ncbi:MAG: hypothetical protein GY739_17630 [Mesoflavibacter sp.]|nr:hypothetical protein [Mesoflavibacter sp.]|tara:strand:+ start:3057 stop:3227 length:171 start_codon:yes stop_codon:yes gene_type:complete
MNVTTLSTDELDRIAIAILEDYGSDLTTDELREVIFAYFDNISGHTIPYIPLKMRD